MALFIHSEADIAQHIKKVDNFVEFLFDQMEIPASDAIFRLKQSMRYSATNGGKRFRPVLSVLVGELFGCDENKILPFAAAVEFIHTYSLIHDDLPCMDNDDIRRGQPTNHKIYDEATALLAGDALLTESFLLVSKHYGESGFLLGRLITLLSLASGLRGMVGGQAMDLAAEGKKLTLAELTQMHRLKTGCLIQLSIEGAAEIAQAQEHEVKALKEFGENLGLAFQVADDILDFHEKGQEDRSFVTLLGMTGARDYLKKTSDLALGQLRKVSLKAVHLEYLIQFNQSRST